METDPVLLIPSPPLCRSSHNQSIPQCTLQYPSQHGSVWIGLSWFKCILWLTSLRLSCAVFFTDLTLTQGGCLSLLLIDGDVAFLLSSVARSCLSIFFYSASLLCFSPLALSASLCCLSRFFFSSLCHSDDVRDHGRGNKGHRFLASWWAVVMWLRLKQPLKFTNKPHRPSAKTDLCDAFHKLRFSPSLGCSTLCTEKRKALQFRRRLKGFRVKALTSICRLGTVDEKVTLLCLTWIYVALVFSLKSVYEPGT